ncbi:Hypothetical_protein [Hexamita inflata]|uniref:Hypothetical_protein n=1 Tax=Hexamita inflata TaxID=28002 RepID=A0AA86QK07_9EUKA|nr:Hypothetical protein HINF_LOCUS48574 [Hexamita inflata]
MGFGFKFNNQEADSLNIRKNSIMLGSLWWMVWQMMSDTPFFLLILRIPNLRFCHTLSFFKNQQLTENLEIRDIHAGEIIQSSILELDLQNLMIVAVHNYDQLQQVVQLYYSSRII